MEDSILYVAYANNQNLHTGTRACVVNLRLSDHDEYTYGV